ncbi:glycosyltransferase family 25 protein [Steroidobacter flavus]|uniref:Glycosyltransferase family 25 protein n=1 Tax=Steroidobacter flavus TaxID=1842136 RepID=A0ABV8T0C4_9GAMM
MADLQSSILFRAAKNYREYRRLRRLRNQPLSVAPQTYPAYVINLERSPERRLYITSHLRSLGIEPTVVPAFDGKKMSLDEEIRAGRYNDEVSRKSFDRSLSMAEIGCGRSHLSIYQRMVRDGTPYALVSEDDAQFAPDARDRIDAAIKAAPADWGVIQLRFDTRHFEPAVNGLVKFKFGDSLPVAATAYLISQRAARVLAENTLPIRYPADSLLGRVDQWGLQAHGVWPELVGVNNVFPSNIQGTRNSRFRASNFVKNLLLKVFG